MAAKVEDTLEQKILELKPWVDKLRRRTVAEQRQKILFSDKKISLFLEKNSLFLKNFSKQPLYLIVSLFMIDQFDSLIKKRDLAYTFDLLKILCQVESLYFEIGGVIGYHYKILTLLRSKKDNSLSHDDIYHLPHFFDLTEKNSHAIYSGIKNLPLMAEIYPVGGAADRLHLQDEKTLEPLPAAKLPFSGRLLLEHMILDLQAREYLHYKLFDKQVITPIAMMTSKAKNNEAHILEICKKNNWFGRGKQNFRFFQQPSVPTVDMSGNWCKKNPDTLLLKPGGHGFLWKLAKDHKIFEWFFSLGRKKALIRQINNPIAGLDDGIFSFIGIGCEKEMLFGFSSCPRLPGSAEGLNVLVERKNKDRFSYFLSNIEYCDLSQYGLKDNSFTSNTNILFTDLKAILDATDKMPLPGLLVNAKTAKVYEKNTYVEKKVVRLETMMQNIADAFAEKQKNLKRSYITYNTREKTISPAKKAYKGQSYLETPQKCYYDFYKNAAELLSLCKVKTPCLDTFEKQLDKGPSFIFIYHPALGPIYHIISQKITGGMFHYGAEARLEVAELNWKNVELEGSLLINIKNVMGKMDETLTYSEKQSGKCTLIDVQIKNRGIDRKRSSYWNDKIVRKESLKIDIQGSGEFIAEGVNLFGDHHFVVKDGFLLRLYEENGKIKTEEKRLDSCSWFWKYEIDENKNISLKKGV